MSEARVEAMPEADAPEHLLLQLEGFEGPLDLLLELARAQKIDLAQISILALAEQYLAVIEGARGLKIELAAEWLVMAAWLAWLKSRLLLPRESTDAIEAEESAGWLAGQLAELETMRAGARWLGERDLLGRDVFARGAPESFLEIDRSEFRLDLAGLLLAYLGAARRRVVRYRPPHPHLWTVEAALARLSRLVGRLPDWSELSAYLPDRIGSAEEQRAAIASTLVACLELTRTGAMRLRQERPFGPILLGREATA